VIFGMLGLRGSGNVEDQRKGTMEEGTSGNRGVNSNRNQKKSLREEKEENTER